MNEKIISPCISICRTDPRTGYCYGCARTNEEKKIWKEEKTTFSWKKENLNILIERMSGWQLETFKVSYTLEYGPTEMHIHKDALDDHKNLLIIDDLLATGGTALAAVDLIEMFENKKIVGAGFIINLPDLNGDKKLKERGIKIHSLMDF